MPVTVNTTDKQVMLVHWNFFKYEDVNYAIAVLLLNWSSVTQLF